MSDRNDRPWASGALLILVGVWLLVQAAIGDLPGRLLSWGGANLEGRLTRSDPQGRGGAFSSGGGAGGGGGAVGAS